VVQRVGRDEDQQIAGHVAEDEDDQQEARQGHDVLAAE